MGKSSWPVPGDVIKKVEPAAPEGFTSQMQSDIQDVIDAVVAELESPVGFGTDGNGTGRKFTWPDSGTTGVGLQTTRTYDGNGYPQLRVDDVYQDDLNPVVVKAYTATLTDVVVRQGRYGLGNNTLIRPQSTGSILGTSYAMPGVFPMGLQNVFVTATFVYDKYIPNDVWEAVRMESARRILVQGAVSLEGIGEIVQIGGFMINTASGVMVWQQTSPLAIFHDTWKNCVNRYRIHSGRMRAVAAGRMS